jgi:hypothetical protein
MECCMDTGKCSARPGMSPKMERILVSLGLVLILESIRTVLTLVLFLLLMSTTDKVSVVPL